MICAVPGCTEVFSGYIYILVVQVSVTLFVVGSGPDIDVTVEGSGTEPPVTRPIYPPEGDGKGKNYSVFKEYSDFEVPMPDNHHC